MPGPTRRRALEGFLGVAIVTAAALGAAVVGREPLRSSTNPPAAEVPTRRRAPVSADQRVEIEVSFGRPADPDRRSAAGNPGYFGKFVFTRIRYGTALGDGRFWGGGARWAHDYPRADRHLSRLLDEITTIDTETGGTNVLVLDDRELFKHPVAYISEPGFWTMTANEAAAVRAYVRKGGFLIFDDFENEQWHNLETQLRRVLPEYRPIAIDVEHPIFHAFFDLETIDFPHPLVDVRPTYYGLFERNDPTHRMLAIINYNNDIAEYWEWSDTGWLPIEFTNEAYKLGVNYVVYAMTH